MLKELFEITPLTPQEKRIIDYIQKNPECIMNHNAKELAQLTYVSSPTIVRLTKKLGFHGYPDFQLTYAKEYSMFQTENIQLSQESSIDDIIQYLPKIYNRIFKETQHLVKKEAFVRTINYMIQAKQIDFYANDNNYSEVQSACLKLNTLGIRAQAFNTLSQQYVDTFLPQNVLSFVVSHSGKNQTMVDAAYYLRKKRARIIAITGILDPTLSLICNESLYIDASLFYHPGNLMLYGLSIHYILDILIVSLMQKRKRL
ncbi:MurR/RpiR family transcriptional regulator [Candidatus Stoquefichus massiliensis]|uniref:MurR/RpiR family transcriptional regulator n=1 Tax=Candidatus Stoquefichus massiliensis TaxID=1470350 RepID=UPI000480B341|nr:MurR/RpiR family transcriptional regulator [Candidatus Stoquefichus massiliensis]